MEFEWKCQQAYLKGHTSSYEDVFLTSKSASQLVEKLDVQEELHSLNTSLSDLMQKSKLILFSEERYNVEHVRNWHVDPRVEQMYKGFKMQNQMPHLINYEGKLQAYLYAKVLSQNLFEDYRAGKAEKEVRQMLEHGSYFLQKIL